MVKILISGILGRMGKAVQEISNERKEINLIAGVDKMAKGLNYEVPVYNDFDSLSKEVEVIIDFSHFSLIDEILQYSISKKLPLVLCTTGFTPEMGEKIKKASEKIAIFKSGNMSIGINWISNLVKQSAKNLNNFDIEIIEKHHNQKLDSPSGTALMIRDAVLESKPTYKSVNGREGNLNKRKENEIGIHAVRGGGIIGEHSAIFASTEEVIEIKHSAISRRVFAHGAIEAAIFMKDKEKGLYNMNNLLNL